MATKYKVTITEQVTHHVWIVAPDEERAIRWAILEIESCEVDTIYDREYTGEPLVQEDNE
tara:strand:- start:1472 stop:1651 length:180 start_codon:yes stop_codon:yes gene_type:complete